MLLKVCLSTGATQTYELPQEFDAWLAIVDDRVFQARIRGLSLIHAGTTFALAVPRTFRHVSYMAEVIYGKNGSPRASGTPSAARIGYCADDVMATLLVYFRESPPMSRVDVQRIGRPRWLSTDRQQGEQ